MYSGVMKAPLPLLRGDSGARIRGYVEAEAAAHNSRRTLRNMRARVCEVLRLDEDEPYMGYKLRHLATGSTSESVVARDFVIFVRTRV
jgi:hypothetical protein